MLTMQEPLVSQHTLRRSLSRRPEKSEPYPGGIRQPLHWHSYCKSRQRDSGLWFCSKNHELRGKMLRQVVKLLNSGIVSDGGFHRNFTAPSASDSAYSPAPVAAHTSDSFKEKMWTWAILCGKTFLITQICRGAWTWCAYLKASSIFSQLQNHCIISPVTQVVSQFTHKYNKFVSYFSCLHNIDIWVQKYCD